ncbi:MAG: EF-hand domain-containing protein [archaeon]|nr:EF-hand domain-containing protein [archaeon]
MFDKDGNGSITINEILDIYGALGHVIPKNELSEMMSDSDTNEDGFITFHEFLGLYKNHIHFKLQEKKLIEAFMICDCDGDKYVSFNELKRIMKEVGENLKDSQIKAMLKEVDMDHDNKIDFREFINLMKNL